MGKRAFLFAAYDLAFVGGRLALASRPRSRCKINFADKALVFAAVPVDELHQWRRWNVRMNARAVKAKQGGLKVVVR